MNKKKQYKFVKEVIRRGHLMVNVPVFIIMFGTPFLLPYIASLFSTDGIVVLSFFLGLFLGFVLAWTWWSFSITKWRMWAIENTHQNDWAEINRIAVKEKLIWSEGHRFEKTEIRNKKENEEIKAFYDKINEVSQENTLEKIEDDLSIPPKSEYYFDRSELIFETVVNLLLCCFGIYLIRYYNFGFGLFFTVLMIFAFDFKAIKISITERFKLN